MFSRRERAEGRFRELLVRWLAKLPPGGWEGTSHELGDVLYAFCERHRLFAFVPISAGKRVAGMAEFFDAHGFAITFTRTAEARFIRIKPAG